MLDKRVDIAPDNVAIEFHKGLCKNCSICKRTCANFSGVDGTYNSTPVCTYCGQCVVVCPFKSLTGRDEYQEVKKHINDPDKIVIFNTAPAVRVALGEEFDMPFGSFVEGKMVSLLRTLGAKYVLDVNFGADVTIMEEASEFIERLQENKHLPQFTSCCSAWVRYVETYYPELIDHLSTTKSPIAIQGATLKTYFAKKMNIDPKKIINVTVTPCTSKKAEIRREEFCDSGKYWGIDDMRDTDYIITTVELAKWAKEEGIDFESLEDSKFDKLMGEYSGGGLLFGNTGGVMEAALRTAYKLVNNKKAPDIIYELSPLMGYEEVRDATLKIGDFTIKIAIIYGTKNASKLLDFIKENKSAYHFIEVMACPGGCIGGGGQPKLKPNKLKEARTNRMEGLYNKDKEMDTRTSYENSELQKMYEEFYGEPLSELSEELLHTDFVDRSSDLL
ncbi:hydrogenase [Candidatus Epulonipiscium fishelsonii]|uniref:Hydrogenase n=1 Tax=Candidatus Epulonipiscium fishelsonii TaxID=77094 RepID=A0ACC8X8R4_9FIRM|nr:hydrogenase [Epulopiscium sp. SCG-B11WGA-EpuloA1]ONI43673.1 hydrogenase [Epulopiscium sp. SCG-B05WGA-EpuloA1]